MPAPIPPVLSPYLFPSPPGSLLLVASVLSALANWVVVRSILAALHENEGQNVRSFENSATEPIFPGRRVILLSILKPLSLWTEIGKKAGLDIPGLIAKRRLFYIDGLEIYGQAVPPRVSSSTSVLRSHDLEEVKGALERAINSSYECSRTTAATTRFAGENPDAAEAPILVLDGFEFLVASQPEVTASSISQMLLQVRQRAHSTVMTVSSDGPLLHSCSAATTPLESEHQAFVASMAHQSRLVMQLRSLDTGTAKDVSGVIRISHGGDYEDNSQGQDHPEGEWLYKVSGDGSVRIWGRGE